MADGVGINPGSQVTIATDEVNRGAGNVQVQFVKLLDATDGSIYGAVITSAGALKTYDSGVHSAVKNYAMNPNTGAWTEVKSGTILANRIITHIQNNSDVSVEVSFDNALALGQGTLIPTGQTASFSTGTLPVYVQPVSGSSKNIRIIEAA